ncbi:MAG: D-alanyl-D-alanine carboxypeptidase [Bacilli bacterium]|nr:D-alanyl-D-alanine carboxypeptidase [Bacilli bacterium]
MWESVKLFFCYIFLFLTYFLLGDSLKKVVFIILISFLFIFNAKAEEVHLAENAKSAIVIEASTGEVLYEKNADEKLVPASMTKMMSMLLIIEAIENNVLKWDQIITVSEHASSMGGSQILLETGEKMSVKDLFKGVAIASGNDAVVALAEACYGSEGNFVNQMNKKARELNLKNTNFKNPHGLDTADHYSSARDMSLIAKELSKHEKIFEFTSIYEDYLRKDTDRKIWLVNTNKLVRFYDGVDGLKTGFTNGAGYCITATAKKGGMRIISVVMGEPTSKMRNKEISEMFDYSFAQYEVKNLLQNKYLGKYRVDSGKDEYARVVPKEEVTVLKKKGEKDSKLKYDMDIQNLKAPLKKGDKVGILNLKEDDKIVRKIDLTVDKDVSQINFFELYLRNMKDMIIGNLNVN